MKVALIVALVVLLMVLVWEFGDPVGMQKRYAKLTANRIRLFDIIAAVVFILTIWQLTR